MVAILLIATFFITSADSATFVLGKQTFNGSLYPPNKIKLVWGIVQAATAAVLLWSGELQGLQTAAIITAFPFAFILIAMMFSMVKTLREELASI
ncbi:hypothetical protein DMO16_06875 [Fictibacillus sp. S7]|nr:hypothetical protein DMO16_06875 [Fictibacillus sp. S7]